MYGLRNMALALIVARLASLAFFCVDWEPPGSYGAGEMDSPVSAMALSALRGEQKPLSSRAGRRLRTQLRTLIRRALRALRSRPCGFHGRCADAAGHARRARRTVLLYIHQSPPDGAALNERASAKPVCTCVQMGINTTR